MKQGARQQEGQQGQGEEQRQEGQAGSGGANASRDGAGAYEERLAKRDRCIAGFEVQVADAAKKAEAVEALMGEIAELRAQGESGRIDFRLQLAGVRNVKAVCAVPAPLREVTSYMDGFEATAGSRYLFITPILKGVLDDYFYANPVRSNRVLERFARIVEVPQTRFYTAVDLLSGDEDSFGYRQGAGAYEPTEDVMVEDGKTYHQKLGLEYMPVGNQTSEETTPTGVLSSWAFGSVRVYGGRMR